MPECGQVGAENWGGGGFPHSTVHTPPPGPGPAAPTSGPRRAEDSEAHVPPASPVPPPVAHVPLCLHGFSVFSFPTGFTNKDQEVKNVKVHTAPMMSHVRG